jgi:predicted nucleic acid-binding protein
MLAIDTSVLVRFVTGDHPEQSPRARKLLETSDIHVSHTVMLESEWVLRSVYGFTRPDTIRALRAFAGLPGVAAQDPPLLVHALDLAEEGMDFADALHLAAAGGCDAFVTFDRKLVSRAKGRSAITVREP